MFIVTIRYLSLAKMHALLATFPLMVMAIAAVFLKEPVGIRRWDAVFVGLLGVLVILRPGLAAIQPAALLALVTALMFTAYNVMTRLVSRYDDGETSTVYMAVVGLEVMTAIGPVLLGDTNTIRLGLVAGLINFGCNWAPSVDQSTRSRTSIIIAAVQLYIIGFCDHCWLHIF
jgi:drug/metabolite transporter (DMT)-like permease